MATVTVTFAKSHFSELLEQVAAGDEVIITRRSVPIARLVAAKPRRVPGRWKGREGYQISDSFFDPLPEEELRLWEGGDD